MQLISFFNTFILKKYYYWLVVLFIVSVFFLLQALDIPIVTSIDSLVPQNDPDLVFYNDFRAEFGADDVIAIALEFDSVFTKDALKYIKALSAKLEELNEIESTLSLYNAEDLRGDNNTFLVRPLISKDEGLTEANILEIKERALKIPLIRDNLLNKSLTSTILLVRTSRRKDNPDFEALTIRKIKDVLGALSRPRNLKAIHMAGWPIVDVEMASRMNRDVAIFIPITATIMALVLYGMFGQPILVLTIMLTMCASLVWTMGFLKIIGGAMSPLTSILPPLIMALSLADGIHIASRFQNMRLSNNSQSTRDIILNTVHDTCWPCLLTSITTAIGFASLSISKIPAINQFGISAAMGMMAEFFLAFTLMICLLYLFYIKMNRNAYIKRKRDLFLKGLAPLIPFLQKKYKFIIFCSTGSLAIMFLGMLNLTVDTNLLEYFHKSTKIRQDALFIDNEFGGENTIEISVKSEVGDNLMKVNILEKLEELSNFIESKEGISRVISPINFLRLMNWAFHGEKESAYSIPRDNNLIAQYLLLYDGDEFHRFLNETQDHARISAVTSIHNSMTLSSYFEEIRRKIKGLYANVPVSLRITGKNFLSNKTVEEIVSNQVSSLLLATIIILVIMFAVLRSAWLGFIALVPNIVPIFGNLGLMGWLGIPINTATAIISAVAIGIAVDDTIHFLVSYKRNRGFGMSKMQALEATLATKGMAAFTTSFVLVLGFGILAISSFVPTAQFGLLSANIMIMAFLADIFILPSLLLIMNKE